MIDTLKEVLAEQPMGYPLLGVIGLAAAMIVVAFAVGVSRGRVVRRLRKALDAAQHSERQGRFRSWTAVSTSAALLSIPLLTLLSIQQARAMMLRASLEADPSQKAVMLAKGISGQMNSLFLALSALTLLLPLAGAALGLCISRRSQLRGLKRAGTIAEREGTESAAARAWRAHPGLRAAHGVPLLAGIGLWWSVLTSGMLRWLTDLVTAFGAVAGVDPSQKSKMLLVAMGEAHEHLDSLWPQLAIFGVTLVGFAFWALYLRSPARRRRRMAPALADTPQPSWRATLVFCSCALGIAGLCVIIGGPYHWENNNPLPVKSTGSILPPGALKSLPALVGPDALVRSPLIEVTASQLLLEGQEINGAKEFQEQFQRMRRAYELTHPDEPFPGRALLVAKGDLEMHHVEDVLRGALAAGYPNISLAFGQQTTLRRPALGLLPRVDESAANIECVAERGDMKAYRFDGREPGGKGPLLLAPPARLTYGRFAKVVVAARRAKRKVLLLVSSPNEQKNRPTSPP